MAQEPKRRWAASILMPSVLALVVLSSGQAPAEDATRELAADRDLQAGLAVKLRLSRQDGVPIERPDPGSAFRIEFELTDAATDTPARGMHPAVWLRPREATNSSCDEAGRAWRATGRLPLGAIDLNGTVVATHDDAGKLAFVDPRLDLATSNMLSISDTEGEVFELAADRDGQRILLRGADEIRARRIDGSTESLMQSGGPTRMLALSGAGVWAATDGSLKRLDGHGTFEVARDGEISILRDARPPGSRPAAPSASMEPELIIATSAGAGLLIHADGRVQRFAAGPIRDVVYAPIAGGTLALGQDRLVTLASLSSGAKASVGLPADADRLELDPTQRLALAWSEANSAVSFVEISTMRLAGALSFDRPIREVAFAGNNLFALLDDLSAVIAIDLATVAPGGEPKLHSIPLGPATTVPLGSGPYLASLAPQPKVMAAHRPTQTVFIVTAEGGERMPPMTAFRLKSGLPRALLVLDRSLQEAAAGRYATTAIGPQAGPWELVLTTGTGGLTTCFAIDVGDGILARRDDRIRLTVSVEPVRLPRSDDFGESELLIHVDAGDYRTALADKLPFSVMALDRPWRANVVAERLDAGRYRGRVRLPGAGQYPIIPAFALPRRSEVRPGLIQVQSSSE